MALTEKQKKFVDEYLIDLNATQAAIRAGYSEKTARSVGAENLTKPDIQKEIEKRMKARQKRTEITQDWVLNELCKIASANGTDFAKVVDEPVIKDGQYVVDPDTGRIRTYPAVKLVKTDELPEDKKAAVAAIKEGKYGVSVDSYDRVKALELLGRHLGMFKDKVEVSGSVDVNDPFKELSTDELKKLIRDG